MKWMMILFVLAFSMSSFATRDDRLVDRCVFPAIAALNYEAHKLNETFMLGSIRVCGIDSRKLNPYKYVWFCGETKQSQQEVKVLLRSVMGGSCKRI
ncbi:hypothetical protein [Peredibacter starrii]|uniref:Uncharacterized protein n=1 Tax=Peredibacter starrii TaxID=28202 RepID=A0AAX4HLW9_9BACT|nr:hypothetical protein [Peredibacter starrii]WPU64175.1 hypothetical protein SOO65_15885 [Peredibacter starrii]